MTCCSHWHWKICLILGQCENNFVAVCKFFWQIWSWCPDSSVLSLQSCICCPVLAVVVPLKYLAYRTTAFFMRMFSGMAISARNFLRNVICKKNYQIDFIPLDTFFFLSGANFITVQFFQSISLKKLNRNFYFDDFLFKSSGLVLIEMCYNWCYFYLPLIDLGCQRRFFSVDGCNFDVVSCLNDVMYSMSMGLQ